MKYKELGSLLAAVTGIGALVMGARYTSHISDSDQTAPSTTASNSAKKPDSSTPYVRTKGEKIRVGIIGGMGTEAETSLFRYLTTTQKILGVNGDGDYLSTFYANDPIIPDRTAFLLHGGKDPKPAVQDHLTRLQYEGMDIAGAVCNTFHAPKIVGVLQESNPTMPILNLVRATEIFIQQNYRKQRVGLMATDGTLAVDIYDNKSKLTPAPEYQQKLMMAIYAIKAGYHEKDLTQSETREAMLHTLQQHPNTRKYTQELTEADMKAPIEWLVETVKHLQDDKKAEVVIMGCTEIPIALKPEHSTIPLVDTIKVLTLSLALVARNPSLIAYVDEYKHQPTWNNPEMLSRMYGVLAESLDLSRHPKQLAEFMGKPYPEKGVAPPGSQVKGNSAIGNIPCKIASKYVTSIGVAA